MNFFSKQQEFLMTPLARHNYLSGSVRSGKSFVANAKVAIEVSRLPRNARGIIVGNTIDSCETNVLRPLLDLVGADNLCWSKSNRDGALFGHEFVIRGANNCRSENSIRGAEFSWAYCDEVTLYPENFYSMLLTRLSKPGAWVIATCNPDDPNHYIKKQYIDNTSLNLRSWSFILTDNIFLDKEYVESVEKEYSGVFYQRFILGRWVRAEGAIYQVFSNYKTNYVYNRLQEKYRYQIVNIGIDYGASKSNSSYTCTGITPGFKEVHALAEGGMVGVHSPDELYTDIEQFYLDCSDKFGHISNIYCDYGALGQVLTQGLKVYFMRKGYPVKIQDCYKGKIIERIQLTLRLIGTNRFRMNALPILTKALESAVWDSKKVDERLDDGTTPIDPLDSFEYSFYSYAGPIILQSNMR